MVGMATGEYRKYKKIHYFILVPENIIRWQKRILQDIDIADEVTLFNPVLVGTEDDCFRRSHINVNLRLRQQGHVTIACFAPWGFTRSCMKMCQSRISLWIYLKLYVDLSEQKHYVDFS